MLGNTITALLEAAMRPVLLAMILALAPSAICAHPGQGIAVDQHGNVYFGDIGRRTIWRLSPDGELQAVVENRWSHQIMLDRNGGLVFESEEYVDGKPTFGIWRISPEGGLATLIPRTSQREDFPGSIFTMDAAGRIYHPSEGVARTIFRRLPNQPKEVFIGGDDAPFNGIRAMTHDAKDMLYVLDSDAVHRVEKDGSVTTVAGGLRLDRPADPPFQHPNPDVANRLYGLAVDPDGVIYIAYHGNRSVLEVQPNGSVSQLYQARSPWSPTGVAVHDGFLYVRESSYVPETGNGGPRILRLDQDGQAEILVTVAAP